MTSDAAKNTKTLAIIFGRTCKRSVSSHLDRWTYVRTNERTNGRTDGWLSVNGFRGCRTRAPPRGLHEEGGGRRFSVRHSATY